MEMCHLVQHVVCGSTVLCDYAQHKSVCSNKRTGSTTQHSDFCVNVHNSDIMPQHSTYVPKNIDTTTSPNHGKHTPRHCHVLHAGIVRSVLYVTMILMNQGVWLLSVEKK
jgi:hypothetical protein